MIPKNITREHITKAIESIDQEQIPSNRESTKFVLQYNSKYYPPKYVISVANKFANGTELPPEEFSGGDETNNFLSSLEFTVLPKDVFSWNIISETTIQKTLDKSAFVNHGTAIPHELISFFRVENPVGGEMHDILLKCGNQNYAARSSIDKQPNPRARLFWKSDFDQMLQTAYPDIFEAMSDGIVESQDWVKLSIKQTALENVFEVGFSEVQPVDLERATVLNNVQLCDKFKCSPQGGMRRAKRTNSLVLISDHTTAIYDDRWIEDEFYYTGMGLTGDQDIGSQQNKTLHQSTLNKVLQLNKVSGVHKDIPFNNIHFSTAIQEAWEIHTNGEDK